MKTIACVILATLLAGCAHPNLAGIGAAMRGQQDYQAQQQGYYRPQQPVTHLEYQCYSDCTSLNRYSYEYCKARCTY